MLLMRNTVKSTDPARSVAPLIASCLRPANVCRNYTEADRLEESVVARIRRSGQQPAVYSYQIQN